jgi:hypothetical protein
MSEFNLTDVEVFDSLISHSLSSAPCCLHLALWNGER